jgi:MFS family permease
MATLGLYLVATVATAFATEAWMFFVFRFFTGMGIGGEYAAINSAIDELIPARNRGQVDLAINGSFWVGSGIGGLAALLLLDTALFSADIGWRLAFAAGAMLGLNARSSACRCSSGRRSCTTPSPSTSAPSCTASSASAPARSRGS